MANINPKSNKSSGSMTMADLLAKHQSNFVKVQKGEVLEAVITKLTSSEILVDIGSKTEAVVMEKDRNLLRNLLSTLKIGDKVMVAVLNPESDMGNPVVSLRKFMDEKIWQKLEELKAKKSEVEINIDELTKGGFLVSTKDGISGFLPNSQAIFVQDAQALLGKPTKALVIEVSKPLKKIIFSQKAAMGSEDFDAAVKELKIGQKIETTISNIAPFGIFTMVSFGDRKAEGFVHISEVSWEKIATVPDNYKSGEKIQTQVIGFDNNAKRINLSIKKLSKDPFEEKLMSFAKDQKISGEISKILSSGALVNVEEGIEGFIKKDKIPPTMTLKEGQSVNATVIEIDARKHRLILVPVLKEKPIGYR